MTDSLLVVGLGNPGPGYAGNRHNVGKMVLDQLADRFGGKFKSHKAGAQVAEVRTAPGGPKLILAKPTSYMNVSGRPVSGLLSFYSLTVESLLVVHDELDLPFDSLRLKVGGGHGGHNGLRDIIAASGSSDFARLRFGIGRPPGQMDVADFVLKDFSSTERKVLDNLLVESADAVEDVATKGVLAAQQRLHSP